MMVSKKQQDLTVALVAIFLCACQPLVIEATPEPTAPSFFPTGCLYRTTPDDDVECGFLLSFYAISCSNYNRMRCVNCRQRLWRQMQATIGERRVPG